MLCRTKTKSAHGESLISQHGKDERRKIESDKKIKLKRFTDDLSCVSSIHSNVSRALQVRMPTKPKKKIVPAPPQPPIETVTDFAPPITFPQTSIVIAEPPIWTKRKAATKATTAIQPSYKRKRSSPSISELDESMASTHTCPPKLSSNTAPSRQKRRQMKKQQQIQNKSIVSTIKNTSARNQVAEEWNFRVGSCLPIQTYPTQY